LRHQPGRRDARQAKARRGQRAARARPGGAGLAAVAMTGNQYANLVASYIVKNFGDRGIEVYRELFLGKTIIGKNRRIDILALHRASGVALAVECKYQASTGTVDETIPYTLQDMAPSGM